MAVEALLRPGEEAWASALTNLSQRFSTLDAAVVAETLRQQAGHAGKAAAALRKLAPSGPVASAPVEAAATKATQKVPAPAVEATATKTTQKTPAAAAPKKEAPSQGVSTPGTEGSTRVPNSAASASQSEPVKTKPPVVEKVVREVPPAAVALDERKPDSKLLFVAALQGDFQALGCLINARADLNDRYTGRPGAKADKIIDATPLHLVVTMGRADVAETLLKHGADVKAKMSRALGSGKPPEEQYAEMTPLHLAAMEGHTNIVEMLLTFGADKAARMKLTECKGADQQERGITPLEIAREMESKGHSRESVISLLTK